VARGILEDMELLSNPEIQLQKLISNPDPNNFLIRVDAIPNKDSLLYYLNREMEDFDLFTDCKLAVYDDSKASYLYQAYVPTAGSHNSLNSGNALPHYKRNYSYIQLFFPHRNNYILHEITFWIVISIILLLLLVALGASVFYLYREKFLNEVQNDFIRNITHEFQTPLTTLKLGLDMLSKPAVLQRSEKLEKYISLMHAQTDYLHSHIENLVKVIKTDNVPLTIHKEKLNPNELIRQAIEQMQFQIEEKEASVEVDANSENTIIRADRNNLYIALLNLISNAIKYSKHPKINITMSDENRRYLILIRDNGIGIDKKFLSKLFGKFYRVPSGDVYNAKGLGLGLYFVRKIIEAHGGKIIVNSVVGIGTEFKIILPVD
jgi:two-component system phosphate regulon sensor histidine kinase PhoR